jgi:deazaflavin-dependent oxidoreductase (nitroreductase family)
VSKSGMAGASCLRSTRVMLVGCARPVPGQTLIVSRSETSGGLPGRQQRLDRQSARFTAAVQWLGRQRWFAILGRRFVPIDRWLFLRSDGRWSALSRAGLPSLLLTTTGRRSGEARTQPLLYALDGDGYVVVGSNWGQHHHPAWSANLLAEPAAQVTIGDREILVRAVLAKGAERERLWALLVRLWPAYQTYRERAGGRELRVFRLSPRA